MKELHMIFKESTELHKEFLNLENEKKESLAAADLTKLDNVVEREQALYLKMKILEQKTVKFINRIKMPGKSFKEIINTVNDTEEKKLFEEEYNELKQIIDELTKVNKICKTLLEIRLNRVDLALRKLGVSDNTNLNIDGNKKSEGRLLSKNI